MVLTPTSPIYRRLIIRENAAASRPGYRNGSFRLHDSLAGLTKLTYTLEMEPLADAKRDLPKVEGTSLSVDAVLNGMAWRFFTGNNPDDGSDSKSPHGVSLTADVIAAWLKSGPLGPRAKDEEIDKNAQAVILIIQAMVHAADENEMRNWQANNSGKNVSRLQAVVARWQESQQIRNEKKEHPFLAAGVADKNWTVADKISWEPTASILMVSVPLMLAVWGIGLWLLLRYGRASKDQA